jgi:hypothetical protein
LEGRKTTYSNKFEGGGVSVHEKPVFLPENRLTGAVENGQKMQLGYTDKFFIPAEKGVAKKRKMEENPLKQRIETRKENLLMQNDTPWRQDLPPVEGGVALMETMIKDIASSTNSSSKVSKRGRPAQVSWPFLTLGILWCVLRGWQSQLDLWRLISFFGLGCFAPVPVGDQAIYNRLERSLDRMQQLCLQVSHWLFDWLAPYEDRSLAPFAKEVYAQDARKLDSMKRWLPQLRDLPTGSMDLLAGRLCGLFDVRRQQWKRLDFLPDPLANCQAHAREMLETVPGVLLL